MKCKNLKQLNCFTNCSKYIIIFEIKCYSPNNFFENITVKQLDKLLYKTSNKKKTIAKLQTLQLLNCLQCGICNNL